MASAARATTDARTRARSRRVEEDVLLTAVMCLLAYGAVMVYSASSANTVLQAGGDGTGYLLRYVLYGALGFGAMWFVARRSLEQVLRLTGPLLAIALGCLVLVRMPGFGVEVNGARRWLGAGPLVFQPSEIAKLALVLYAARFLAERPNRIRTLGDLTPLGLVAGAVAGLVAIQPDLGTTLVIAATVLALMFASGVPSRVLWTLLGSGAALVTMFAMLEPYRRARLTSFLNPWDSAGDAGFQAVQGQIALGSGGVLGHGLGQSVQKIAYLPEAHTDFILAIIGEELGVIGVVALLFLYAMIAWAGLRIAKQAKGRYAALVAAGCTSLILCQAILNVFVVLGLAPLTGVPLPFISYGSTNLMVLLVCSGLLINVSRGGSVHLRVVTGGADRARSGTDARADLRDRGRGDSRSRDSRAGGGRRAAG
jgi:cell division protein FtsW